MTTTGHSTTTPMSAMAGLSHISGARRRMAAGIWLPYDGGRRGPGRVGRPVPGGLVCGLEQSGGPAGQLVADDEAICCSEFSSADGLPVTAVPIVCWILAFTLAQAVSLGYCTEFGSAFRNGAKIASELRACVAVVVAGSRSYSLSNCTWYLSW